MIKKILKKIFCKKYIQIEFLVDNYDQTFWRYVYFENKKGINKGEIIDGILTQYETIVSYVKKSHVYKTNNPQGTKINL